jgi:hypothetical protein
MNGEIACVLWGGSVCYRRFVVGWRLFVGGDAGDARILTVITILEFAQGVTMDEFLSLPLAARVAVGQASLDCKFCKEGLQNASVARGSFAASRRPSQSGIVTRPGTVGSFSAVRRRRGSLPMAYVEHEVSKECGEIVREISHASAATRESVIRQLQALTYCRAKV